MLLQWELRTELGVQLGKEQLSIEDQSPSGRLLGLMCGARSLGLLGRDDAQT